MGLSGLQKWRLRGRLSGQQRWHQIAVSKTAAKVETEVVTEGAAVVVSEVTITEARWRLRW